MRQVFCFFFFISTGLLFAQPELEKELSFFGDSISENLDAKFFHPVSHFDFVSKKEGTKEISVKPYYNYSLNGGGGFVSNTTFIGNAYGQVGVQYKSRNIRGNFSFEAVQADFSPSISNLVDSTSVVSGFNVAEKNDAGYFSKRFTGRLNFQLSKHFNTEIGNSTNFWGAGYRSMVLGENAAPYPYLKLTTKVWKVQYTNLFMQLRDFNLTSLRDDIRKKYVATHALEFDVNDFFSFAIFESVVWQATDTLSSRSFELNYLNPIIFYRPVEFAQGSADNVLLGLAAQLKFEQNLIWYGQVFLDEFLLSEIRERSGWWGNKFGVQLGFKFRDLDKKLWGYSEFNLSRPFTYTHGSVLQNYGHLNQSLAHPLGTNFYEWSTGAQIEKNKWFYTLKFNWALYGRDRDGDNYGGNIFRSYKKPFKGNGNYIGQGNTHHSYIAQASATRPLGKSEKVFVSFGYSMRHIKSSFNLINEHLFTIGIQSKLPRLNRKTSEGGLLNFQQDF